MPTTREMATERIYFKMAESCESFIMPSRSTIFRRKQKEDDPEKYAEYLEKQRKKGKKYREEEKRKIEENVLTRAQLEERNRKHEEKKRWLRAYYYKRKAEKSMSRQTRNSATPSTLAAQTPRKRVRDMDPEEYKAHRAMMRRKQRAALSSQKKTAIRAADRKRHKEAYYATRVERLGLGENEKETPGPSGGRMRQSIYNLNHEYKEKTRQLGMSNSEYAKATLNLLNPRTPDKRQAIRVEQKAHPCKSLFRELEGEEEEPEVCLEIEGELAVPLEDAPMLGPITEGDIEGLDKNLHWRIKHFYCLAGVSRLLPHSRYSTKHGPARVMEMTVREAHKKFVDKNGEGVVGLTLFQQLRPKNVRLMGSVPIDSCLCIYCTNIRLKLTALNSALGPGTTLPKETRLFGFLTCLYEGDWPDIQCIDGKCISCQDRMRIFKVLCRDIQQEKIRWLHWERNEQGKMEPQTKNGVVRELIEEMGKDVNEPTKGTSFLQHIFRAFWQFSQFKKCKDSPDEGEVIMVQDFGENRKAAYSCEIKSAHFGKSQITVHPVVCFYRLGGDVIRESHMFLSDDIMHDHHAVKEFTLRSLDLLKKSGVQLKKVTMWSDGAASQYKGRGTFHDLSVMSEYEVQRCYFGSEHGKGEADGETGLLSQFIRRAVHQGHSFRGAADMVTYLSGKYGSARRRYVLVNDIPRCEVEDVSAIPGTRKMHQFVRKADYIIAARNLACFCTACREGRPNRCANAETVGSYDTFKLKESAETVLNTAFMEPTEPETQPGTSTGNPDPLPKVGDYLRLKCFIHKRIEKIFYAVVIEVPDEAKEDGFSVSFLSRSGSHYVFPDKEDVGLIIKGPPDHYSWNVIRGGDVNVDQRGHYTFNV